MIQISSNGPAIVLALRNEPLAVRKAMVRAMNRAIAGARTVMKTAIAADLGIKSGVVLEELTRRTRLATASQPSAQFGAGLTRIPIMDFNARASKRGGVTYKSEGATKTISNAFIATMKNGHQGVFARKGKKRLPIQEKRGASLGHVFDKYRPDGIARLEEAFGENFDHELAYARSENG